MRIAVTRNENGRYHVENEKGDVFEFYMVATKGGPRLALVGPPRWCGGERPVDAATAESAARAAAIGRARSDGLPV